MFDLKSLSMKDTMTLQLRHPVTDELLFADEDKKMPVSVTLYGQASKQYRNAINAMQNRSLKRDKKKVTAEVLREEGIELLVACTAKWNHLVVDGEKVADENAYRALYSNAEYGWLKDQVDVGLGDTSAFLNQ